MTTRVAFLFPGQGSQAVGMGADNHAASTAAQRIFATADDALGFSLSDLCFSAPKRPCAKRSMRNRLLSL